MACGFSSVDGSIAVGAPLGVGGVQGGGEGPGVVSKVVLIIELGSLNLELEPEAARGSKVRVSADWGSGLLGGSGHKLRLLRLRPGCGSGEPLGLSGGGGLGGGNSFVVCRRPTVCSLTYLDVTEGRVLVQRAAD